MGPDSESSSDSTLHRPGRVKYLVRDHFSSSEHVMSILMDAPWGCAVEDDVSGFLYSELRAFDEVGEIGFKKRQGGAVGGAH